MAALGVIIVNEASRFLLNVNLTAFSVTSLAVLEPRQNKMAPAGAMYRYANLLG
jgi:hypothetical protein